MAERQGAFPVAKVKNHRKARSPKTKEGKRKELKTERSNNHTTQKQGERRERERERAPTLLLSHSQPATLTVALTDRQTQMDRASKQADTLTSKLTNKQTCKQTN